MKTQVAINITNDILDKAKEYAAKNNLSLSALIEQLLDQLLTKPYKTFEDLPISDWVQMVSQGEPEYNKTPLTRKSAKDEFFSSKK